MGWTHCPMTTKIMDLQARTMDKEKKMERRHQAMHEPHGQELQEIEMNDILHWMNTA